MHRKTASLIVHPVLAQYILRWYFEATQLISTMSRSTFVCILVFIISFATISSIMAKEIGLNKFKEQYDSTDNPIIQDIPEQVKIVSIFGIFSLLWRPLFQSRALDLLQSTSLIKKINKLKGIK